MHSICLENSKNKKYAYIYSQYKLSDFLGKNNFGKCLFFTVLVLFESLRFEIKDFGKKYKENAFGNETNTNHLNLINMRLLEVGFDVLI